MKKDFSVPYAEIEELINELTKARDTLISEVNLQIANINGQIGSLKKLIAPPEEAPKEIDVSIE